MPARRLAISIALVIFVLPASQALAGKKAAAPRPTHTDQKLVSRADVIAGRATQEERLDLLGANIEAIGGFTFEDSSETEAAADAFALGGYSYPLLATDLDGDGDDEVLLQQYTNRTYVVAVDEGDVLWRHQLPQKSYLVGGLTADLFADPGEEVMFVLYRWNTDKTILGGVGAHGLRWSMPVEMDYFELNGTAQTDDDAQDEIVLTAWPDSGDLTIHVIDGEFGFEQSTFTSTPDQLAIGSSTNAFVTDGAADEPDEAVFVTPLLNGYYAERLNLADGTQTAFEIFPIGEAPGQITQGADYSGDGRRDGYTTEFTFSGETFTESIGVFDAVDLLTVWTKEQPQSQFAHFHAPFHLGDANGDGGQDLCTVEHGYGDGSPLEQSATTIRCFAGDSGVDLWAVSLGAAGEYAWTYETTTSDLDGDGLIDPVIEAEAETCDEDWSCETTTFEATAYSGKNGAPLWSVADPAQDELLYGITDSNLDGVPGDDIFGNVYNPDDDSDAPFEVANGLTLAQSWSAVVDTGDGYGYVDSAIDPDLDGDGDAEVLLTVESYEGIGELECYEYDGEEYCYHEDYVEHAYVVAYEPGGDLLWQLDL